MIEKKVCAIRPKTARDIAIFHFKRTNCIENFQRFKGESKSLTDQINGQNVKKQKFEKKHRPNRMKIDQDTAILSFDDVTDLKHQLPDWQHLALIFSNCLKDIIILSPLVLTPCVYFELQRNYSSLKNIFLILQPLGFGRCYR